MDRNVSEIKSPNDGIMRNYRIFDLFKHITSILLEKRIMIIGKNK